MYEKRENIFYYITTMNENYSHPEIPKEKNIEEYILKGMYRFSNLTETKNTNSVIRIRSNIKRSYCSR